jgi:iron complex transport system substrate-binding protein
MRGRHGFLSRSIAAVAFVTLCGVPFAPVLAAGLPRIASMNVCTDQLLITLADPQQILGLSRFARDTWQSFAADAARRYPILSGGAEDVLVLRPDVVVASLFDKRSTRDRAEAEIARLDAAIARARRAVTDKRYRVLPLSRRGWVSGSDSLVSSLLTETGLFNAAGDLGVGTGGYASLEAIVNAKPDFLLVSEAGDRAEDDGRAFLLHPALERVYPPEKRIVIPERLTVCGGVMLVEALDVLVKELQRVER